MDRPSFDSNILYQALEFAFHRGAVVSADANGNAVVLPGNGIPARGCGLVHCQSMDISTCAVSNVLSL